MRRQPQRTELQVTTHPYRNIRHRSAVAFTAVIALSALAACGGGSAVNTSNTSSGPQAPLGELPGKLEKFADIPAFREPGPAFNAMAAANGKSLFLIPASSEVPFVQTIDAGIKAAGSKLGLTVTDWQNQGKTSQQAQGMLSAIAQRASSVDLLAGLDPATVGPQIAQARAAGIATVASHLYGVGQSPFPGLAATVDAPYQTAGELLADYAIDKTQGKLNALVVTINEVNSTVPMVTGIKQEVGKYCASTCKLTYVNSSISDLATQVPSNVKGALQRDPKIDYVIALYDSAQVPYVISGIQSAGVGNQPKIVTFNGTPSILKLVAEGKVEMDIGENLTWISLAILDQHLRLLAGLPPVKDPMLPLRVWNAANVGQAGSPPQDSVGYGDAYTAGYAKLWQLPPNVSVGTPG